MHNSLKKCRNVGIDEMKRQYSEQENIECVKHKKNIYGRKHLSDRGREKRQEEYNILLKKVSHHCLKIKK